MFEGSQCHAQDLLLLLCSGNTPSGLRGPYGVLNIKPGSATCRASTLPIFLSPSSNMVSISHRVTENFRGGCAHQIEGISHLSGKDSLFTTSGNTRIPTKQLLSFTVYTWLMGVISWDNELSISQKEGASLAYNAASFQKFSVFFQIFFIGWWWVDIWD